MGAKQLINLNYKTKNGRKTTKIFNILGIIWPSVSSHDHGKGIPVY